MATILFSIALLISASSNTAGINHAVDQEERESTPLKSTFRYVDF